MSLKSTVTFSELLPGVVKKHHKNQYLAEGFISLSSILISIEDLFPWVRTRKV